MLRVCDGVLNLIYARVVQILHCHTCTCICKSSRISHPGFTLTSTH